jgi:ABC-2 type transport system ATP-binding protein
LAESLVKRLELPPERRIGQLSRGMQGKAALAVALASRPRLLILDDPTSGLDALVRREFMEGIVNLVQETGSTVFFSSHIIDDVERVADWVGILHEGRLIVQSRLEELKGSVKRVVATFENRVPELNLPEIIHQTVDGRQRELVWRDYEKGGAERLRAAGAVEVQVFDCSLEDLFVAYVRPKPIAEVA